MVLGGLSHSLTPRHRRRSPSLARQYCTKQRAAVSLRLMSKPYGACWLSVTYSRARRELASPSLSLSSRSCQTSVARCIVTRCLCLVSQSLAVERTITLVTPYPSRQRQHISLSFSRSTQIMKAALVVLLALVALAASHPSTLHCRCPFSTPGIR